MPLAIPLSSDDLDKVPTGSSLPRSSDELGPLLPDPGIGAHEAPQLAPTWEDYGHALMSGVHSTKATLYSAAAGLPLDDSHRDYLNGLAEQARRDQQAHEDALSPAASEASQAGVFTPEFWRHPGRAFGIQAAEQAAPLTAMALPALAAGPLGETAAMAGGAAGMGVFNYGQARSDFAATVNSTPDAVLRQHDSDYNRLRSSGMSEGDAKNVYTNNVLSKSNVPIESGLVGLAAGAFGPAARLGGRGASELLSRRVLSGGVEGGLSMGAQAGATTTLQGELTSQTGAPAPTVGDILRTTASQGLLGAVTGGAAGLRGRGEPSLTRDRVERDPTLTPSVAPTSSQQATIHVTPDISQSPEAIRQQTGVKPTQQELHADQTPGVATVTRSNRYERKPVEEPGPSVKTDRPTDTGPAPAPHPVGDAEKVALQNTLPQGPEQGGALTSDSLHSQIPNVQPKDVQSLRGQQVGPPPTRAEVAPPPSIPPARAPVTEPQGRPTEPVQAGQVGVPRTPLETPPAARPAPPIAPPREPPREPAPAPVAAEPRPTTVPIETVQKQPVELPSEPVVTPPPAEPKPTEAKAELPIVEKPAEAPKPTVGEQLKEKAKAKRKERPSELQEPGRIQPAKLEARQDNNRKAEQVVLRHPAGEQDVRSLIPEQPGGLGARTVMRSRLQEMVNDAEKQGVTIPPRITKMVSDEHDHSPAVLILKEAQDFLRKRAPATEDFERYLSREQRLTKGSKEDYADILRDRKLEAEQKLARRKIGPEARVESMAGKEEKIGEIPQEKVEVQEEEAAPEVTKEGAKPTIDSSIKEVKNIPEPPRWADEHNPTDKELEASDEWRQKILDLVNNPIIRRAIELAKKEDRRFDIEDLNPGDLEKFVARIKHGVEALEKPLGQAVEGEKPSDLVMLNKKIVAPVRTGTVREGLKGMDFTHYSPELRPVIKKLANIISKYVGHLPVHYLTDDDLSHTVGYLAYGAYYPKDDQIALNIDRPKADTLLHEAFHAATVKGIREDVNLHAAIIKLQREVLSKAADIQMPESARTSPVEFLTYFMTNPDLQNAAKAIKISDVLARELQIPLWRKGTIWEGMLSAVRRFFGLAPRETNAIEAAMAATEYAMHGRASAERMAFAARISKMQLDKIVHPDVYGDRIEENYKGIQDKISRMGRLEVSPRASAMALYVKKLFMAPDEWVRGLEKTFKMEPDNPLRTWLNHMSSTTNSIRKNLKLSDPIMRQYAQLSADNPQEFQKLTDVLINSTIAGSHPDHELGAGLNEHINYNKKTPENSNMNYKDAIQNHAQNRSDYLALNPDSQKLYRDIRDEMTREHEQVIAAKRKNFTDAIEKGLDQSSLPAELKTAVRKVIKNIELTLEEQEEYGSDKNIQRIRDFDSLAKQALKGPYFPMRQEGNYVVTGTHEYKIPAGAERDPKNPDTIIFPDRKSAWEFEPRNVEGEKLPTDMFNKYYWLEQDGSKTYTTKDDARTTPDARGETTPGEEYHVAVNPRHIEFAETKAEGERYREAMQKAGIKDVSQVVPKKEEPWTYGANAAQTRSMIGHIEKLPGLTWNERQAAKDSVEYAAVASLRGNSLSRSYLKRFRTGTTIDSLRTLDMRRRANASVLAMAKHAPAIDEAIDEMEKFAQQNMQHPSAAELRTAIEMFKDRTYNFGTQQDGLFNTKVSRFWNHVATFGMYKYLTSPAFLIRHQIHIPLFVLPRLAQDIGWWPALKTTMSIYKQMAGGWPVIGRGIKAGVKGIWDYDREPTDFIDALKMERQKRGGNDEEMRMIDQLADWDLLHHTGIDFSTAYRGMSTLERANRRARNISQEIIGSADAVSRVNSALIFYRAARDNLKLSHDDAVRFAADRLRETQGQFSAFNRIGLMRNPAVRAAMQFKSFPLIVLKTITKAMYNSLRVGASPEERWQAVKTLGGIMASSMALAGVGGAIPEPLEDLVDIMNKLGLTDNWPELEDRLRATAVDTFGQEGSTLLMDGLGGALGIDLHHVGGISDLTGLPFVLTGRHPEDTMYKFLAGVPGSIMGDAFTGFGDLQGGSLSQGAQMLLPKVLTDPIRAYQEYTQGVITQAGKVISPPASMPQALARALGFVTTTETRARAAKYIYTTRQQEEKTGKTEAIQQITGAGDYGERLRTMASWNKAHPDDPIRPADLQRAIKQKPQMFGVPETRKNVQQLQQLQHVYGFQ